MLASLIGISLIFVEIYGRDRTVPIEYEISDHILNRYNPDLIPKREKNTTVKVSFSMQLYQIIEVNEPQQYVMINAWVIERWIDHMLGWDPEKFENVSEVMLPHNKLWLPDTTLYNSLTMDMGETKRLMNAQLITKGQGAFVKLLYPTIYKFSCNLDLRLFPFDVQECCMIFGSWTFDNTYIDYFPRKPIIGTANFLPNDEWTVIGTRTNRTEVKYSCCPNNYTLLHYYLHLQRKPLYYVINLVMPTSIITLISIVGFFTSSNINDVREEKITLGITTLLSMSILILMVSDRMPSTSSFIPLIGWFYLFMIMLISMGTIAASAVIGVQKMGIWGKPPGEKMMYWGRWFGRLCWMEMPLVMKEAYAEKRRLDKVRQNSDRKQSLWQKIGKIRKIPPVSSETTLKTTFNLNKSPSPSFHDTLTIYDERKNDGAIEFVADNIIGESMSTSCPNYSNLLLPVEDVNTMKPKRPADVKIGSPSGKSPWNKLLKNLDATPAASPPELLSPRTERRNLAQLEYDWLAAVAERVFLIIFMVLFLIMSFGINFYGLFQWYSARNNPSFLYQNSNLEENDSDPVP